MCPNYPQEKIRYNIPGIDHRIVTSSLRNRFIDTRQIVFVMSGIFTPHGDIAWETDASLWKSKVPPKTLNPSELAALQPWQRRASSTSMDTTTCTFHTASQISNLIYPSIGCMKSLGHACIYTGHFFVPIHSQHAQYVQELNLAQLK